jgi:uncharacterized membrane protein YgcG
MARLAWLWLFALLASTGQADERILEFHSDIDVAVDASVTVTERIRVRSDGDQIRRGIYRDFPTNYRDRLGNNYEVAFDVLSIERDGRESAWHLARLDNGVRVYIGDADVFLSPGEYEYEIRYRTNNQLGFFEDFDELYWNVTGNAWLFPIDSASATVRLPGDAVPDASRATAYVGYVGARGESYAVSDDIDGTITFRTTRTLAPSEGLTIAVGWPKGFVEQPTALDRAGRTLSQNRHWAVFLAGMLSVIFYYTVMWDRHGRDPRYDVIIPIFELPQKESPAAAHYVFNAGYDRDTFVTALISLAVKGYLEIEQRSKKKFTIRRTGQTVDFSAGEQALASALFATSNRVETEESDRAAFQAALAAHKKSLQADYRKLYFKQNGKYVFGGLLLTAAALAGGIVSRDPFAHIEPAVLIAGAAFLVINTVWAFLMRAPTEIGHRALVRLKGLRRYLTIAEGDELRSRYPLDRTPETFEKFLPYAFALDAADTWANQFAGVLDGAFRDAQGRPASMPAWYHADRSGLSSLSDMTHSLGSGFGSSIAAAATPPGSSSGSGGGGSSGGGGGGGGGGGW